MNKQPTVIEDGIVAGNYYNKYATKNPLARKMMANFERCVVEFIVQSGASSIHEVGCGEGHLASELNKIPQVQSVRASDFSTQITAIAQELHGGEGIEFHSKSIYDLEAEEDSAELIVCCEVLEHIENPDRALAVLASLAAPYCIVSVPREPLWRLLNLARGKYISALGNTPGHIQHWSTGGFSALVSQHFDIVATHTPLPWTILLCKRR